MRLYANYAYASISMSSDKLFTDSLDKIFLESDIRFIVESGTFLGLGSTTMLANMVLKHHVNVEHFYTIEVDKVIYVKAVANLSKYTFIQPIWGLSVDPEEALNFIKSDEAIIHHEKYPDIFIDKLDTPQDFYISELQGTIIGNSNRKWWKKLLRPIPEPNVGFQANTFAKILPLAGIDNNIILLDSAGGIGYFEFQMMRKLMIGKKYFLILDDIHHLKHFRSYREVVESGSFQIIAENKAHGWVIAYCSGEQ